MIDTPDVDQLVRRLYDGGVSHGSADFSRWALQQAMDFLGFTEIRWRRENGSSGTSTEIRVGPDNGSPPKLPRTLSVAVPGQSASDWNRFEFSPANDGFSEAESREVKRLAAFIVHADWMYRQIVQARMAGSLRRTDGQALLDPDGQILSCDEEFRELMGGACPDWNERALPEPIDWDKAGGRSGQAMGGLRLYAARVGEFVQVRLCRPHKHEGLSSREIEVAILIARGRTFKQAARELDVAPSTVSTHLYNLYDKLEIKGRAELIDWLSAQRDWI